ncbi:Asp_protease_2 domain-containing protein [Cucumis melo var. makuwa]|uniref:Asp_protease_2 domain-containing protein n=1 Tax=Cucumis melo var. makuwa TaxID=1194695 RepID=A0A5A7U1M9_CUCMM|nr:Asp_protease_2 domain-containing protein [Cucumis melo var. makuwa]TYK25911.1 Asp_protease_2 domain-containing protein [Cucumis melo var. makuwa]
MANQVLVGGAVPVTKVKVPKPKSFCGERDAKALENFIFDLEHYFKATNTVTEEAKVTFTTMHLSEDAKLGLKPWAKTKLYEQRVQDLTSTYVVAEWLFDLASDSQDVRRHESSSLGRNRNSRLSSPKVASLTLDSGDKSNQAEGEVDQIEGEAEARLLRLCWEKDLGRMKAMNSVALPIVRLVKRTTIKLGGWKGPVDFVVVKMDDFDVVLGMEFLLEHQVIPMPSVKCLVITGSFPTVVGKSVCEECLSYDATGVSQTLETVEEIVEVKYFSKSDIRSRYCRVRATEEKGLETTCVTEHGAFFETTFKMVFETKGKPIGCQGRKMLLCAQTDKRAGLCGGILPN